MSSGCMWPDLHWPTRRSTLKARAAAGSGRQDMTMKHCTTHCCPCCQQHSVGTHTQLVECIVVIVAKFIIKFSLFQSVHTPGHTLQTLPTSVMRCTSGEPTTAAYMCPSNTCSEQFFGAVCERCCAMPSDLLAQGTSFVWLQDGWR